MPNTDTLPIEFPLPVGKVEPELPDVSHVLVVANTPNGWTYVVECAATDKRCDEVTNCTHWQCVGEKLVSTPAYYDAMEKADGWAHDIQHVFDPDGDAWEVPTGRCYFAGDITAKQVETGHPIGELQPGRYPIECIAPDDWDESPCSEFVVVDHPASIHAGPKARAEMRAARELEAGKVAADA